MDLTKISTPVRIILDTTRRCQLSCWYCHSSSGPGYRGPELDTLQAIDVIDTADFFEVFDVTITGGEPTLWPGLVPLLRSSERLSYTSLQLITNGLSLSTRVLEAIEGATPIRVCVSLDGVKEVHERNRGERTWERTINGIRKLLAVRAEVTVISVLDSENCHSWPELTYLLAELGVSQHHLSPVCFAGHAMKNYHGLDSRQFEQVRETVDAMQAEFPALALRFNDSLVNGARSRSMPLHQFTETYKGWHVIVRPDAGVKTAVRAWGRSWRADETIGKLNQTRLQDILDPRTTHVASLTPFTRQEEVQRKFHLGATVQQVVEDVQDVAMVEAGSAGHRGSIGDVNLDIAPPANLGVELEVLHDDLVQLPGRYRYRTEHDFGLLFDTVDHHVRILTEQEAAGLGAALEEVHGCIRGY